MGWGTGETSRAGVLRRSVPVVVVVVSVLALVVGGRLDDAPTAGPYRATLPPSPFGGACDPLPDGVVLDLPVQLRSDARVATDAGAARRLTLHYDLRDEDEADRGVDAALRAAGFRPTGDATTAGRDPERWYARPGYGRLGLAVTPFDVDSSSVVRGRITLDLPTGSADDVPATCTDPVQTKRFGSAAGAR